MPCTTLFRSLLQVDAARGYRSGLLAQILAGTEILLIRGIDPDDVEDVVLVLHVLALRFNKQDRLHRLMVAATVVLRALVEVIFQGFHRRDHLVGIGRTGILDRGARKSVV